MQPTFHIICMCACALRSFSRAEAKRTLRPCHCRIMYEYVSNKSVFCVFACVSSHLLLYR